MVAATFSILFSDLFCLNDQFQLVPALHLRQRRRSSCITCLQSSTMLRCRSLLAVTAFYSSKTDLLSSASVFSWCASHVPVRLALLGRDRPWSPRSTMPAPCYSETSGLGASVACLLRAMSGLEQAPSTSVRNSPAPLKCCWNACAVRVQHYPSPEINEQPSLP